MEDYSEIIKICKDNEDEAKIKGMAMGAVILSRMGPIYEKGAVSKFQSLAVQFSRKLSSINTIGEFDVFHEEFMEAVYSQIMNHEGKHLSYGEAQKAINVFLKTYVDRSSLPDAQVANRLRPFLHVPLDSIMIKHFRKKYGADYSSYISPMHEKENEAFKAYEPKFKGKLPDSMLSQLQFIFKDTYLAWQRWFRDIYSEKPVLLDTIWSLER